VPGLATAMPRAGKRFSAAPDAGTVPTGSPRDE